MILTLVKDKNGYSARVNGFLFVLANKSAATLTDAELAVEREYMIISRLGKHPKGWLIEPVTNDHVLVAHNGFECSGSQCCTVAYVPALKLTITPGRLNGLVIEAFNVNASIDGRQPLTPGQCYITKDDAAKRTLAKMGRLVGVPTLDQVSIR